MEEPVVTFPVLYGNGIYVKFDSRGYIQYSDDGVTWPNYAWPNHPESPFRARDAHWEYNGIVFADGYFVAFGRAMVFFGTGLSGNEWLSTITVGGRWLTCNFTGTNWVLMDDQGRTATSEGRHPSIWSISPATISVVGLGDEEMEMF